MNKIRKIISISTIFAVMMYVFTMSASAARVGKNGLYYELNNSEAILVEYKSSKTEVEIPMNIYSWRVVQISDHVFFDNTKITSVTIPESIAKIGDSAFYGCTNLEKVFIPSSVTSFGSSVFAKCEKITIECYAGSAAETYAKENGINYKLVDENTSTDTDNDKKNDTDSNIDTDIKVYKYGDVDFDGNINSSDSLKILRRSVKLENFTNIQEKLADVDSDGNISSSDALDVLRYSVRLSVQSHVGEEVRAQ